MKKQDENNKINNNLKDFEKYCHLWNIIGGGSGKGISKLRKIIDSIESDNYTSPFNKLPSFLIVGKSGSGKNIVTRAIVNSLVLNDVRECNSRYFENGISSRMFFRDSLLETAHIISNIENLSISAESVVWRYLVQGVCKYYNDATREYDYEQYCNGTIILTASNKAKISKSLLDSVDHIIELEPYTKEQQKLIVHQILTAFLGINYVGGEVVLEEIVRQGLGMIGFVIDFLKTCIIVMKAEYLDSLNMGVIEKVKRLAGNNNPPEPIDGIPF